MSYQGSFWQGVEAGEDLLEGRLLELTVFHSERKDDDEIEVDVGAGDVGGGVVGGGLDGDGVVLVEGAGGTRVDCGRCRGLAGDGDDVAGAVTWSFLRNVSRRLAFLLMVDGLGCFLARALPWVSKEKEKPEPKVRASLKAQP